MKHASPLEFRSAEPVETREDGDGDLATAVQAVTELRAAVEQRHGETDKRITSEIGALAKRLDEIDVRTKRPNGGGESADAGVAERRAAYLAYLRRGNGASAEEVRALSVSNDPQGGYLAPPEIATEFIRDLTLFSPIRSIATVRQITGPSIKYPRRTSITNAQWEGETTDEDESNIALGQIDIPARNLATYVDLSNILLSDSGGAAEAEVRMALAEDFGKKEGTAFISGAGPLQPEGMMTNASVGYTPSGNASTLGTAPADLLITVMYSMAAAYRARATWLMNGTTLAAIRKLKDGNGQYLWQPSLQAGQPETILGRPVAECPDMDDIGSGTTPIAFGDIATAYRIIDRVDMSILVNPYLLATKGQTRIHATRRVGGAVVQPNALKKIKCSVS